MLPMAQLQRDWEAIASSGYLTEGRFCRNFEEAVEDAYNMHAVAVNSGGAALMAMMAQEPGEWVGVPANTYAATGIIPAQMGKRVAVFDSSPKDFCLDVSSLSAGLVGLSAVIYTHIGGGISTPSYEAVADWCIKHKVNLYEDAAHAFGAGLDGGLGVIPGTLGRAAIFSLYPTKAIPAGEAGVLVTRDPEFAEACRRFRNYGKKKDDRGDFRYSGTGFNLRLDEWTAAVALRQFERRREIIGARMRDYEKLSEIVPPSVTWRHHNGYKFIVPASFATAHEAGKVYGVTDQLTAFPTGVFVYPRGVTYTGAQAIARGHKCLPIGEGMHDDKTVGELRRWLRGGT